MSSIINIKCRFLVGRVCGPEAGLACGPEKEQKSEARLAAEKLLRSGAIDWPTFCKLEENERMYERNKAKARPVSPSAARQGTTPFETGSPFTLVKGHSVDPNGGPPPTAVTLWTSTANARSRSIASEENRLRLLLDAKRVIYEVILVDDNPTLQREMAKVSGVMRLPQLHVQGIYYGDAWEIQQMEDNGELDLVLQTFSYGTIHWLRYPLE